MVIFKEILLQLFFALMPFILFTVYYRDKTKNYSRKFIMVTSAVCLFLSMTFAASVKEGIFFDVRYVIIFFGLAFGGLSTGFLLLGEFLIYRFYLGGEGLEIAMTIFMITFPLSVLFAKIYRKTHLTSLLTLIAGFVFSTIPIVIMYLYRPEYVLDDPDFHFLTIPLQNSIGIWLLVSLFNKAVSDKELFIRYAQNEKVKAMSHVAASLVHEVRNPLTTVKGFLKLMRKSPLDRENLERYIDISSEEIERTEAILSEYLSISKPLTERRERTDLLRQLQAVMDVMTPYANMNNVHLEVSKPALPLWIYANSEKIKQVLVNFIKNGVEACSEVQNGRVTLRLKQEGKNVLLEIKDNGIGMNEEQISRLGSIYFSTKSNGTGLGLTFSYQVIRSLGGTVSVLSEPKAGTRFTVTLPIAKETDATDVDIYREARQHER